MEIPGASRFNDGVSQSEDTDGRDPAERKPFVRVVASFWYGYHLCAGQLRGQNEIKRMELLVALSQAIQRLPAEP